MAKKSQSKPMKEILTRLEEFELIRTIIFPEEVILNKPVDQWPICDCLISFHSKGFPLSKASNYPSSSLDLLKFKKNLIQIFLLSFSHAHS